MELSNVPTRLLALLVLLLGLWETVEARIARAKIVGADPALVERGEAPLGIVHATDARASGLAEQRWQRSKCRGPCSR